MITAGAGDPVAAVQQRYPVTRTTITTASGVLVCYSLPADAPVELRRAYKSLEVAEREMLVSEGLQLLEREYVENERKLENLRTAWTAQRLMMTMYGPHGPTYSSFTLLAAPESATKWALLGNLVRGATADRALAAIDRLAAAQFQLQQVLVNIAHPDANKPAPPVAAAPEQPRNPRPAPARAVGVPDDVRAAEQTAARAEAAAEERERSARAAEIAAEDRYRASLPDDREATRTAWLAAREEWEQARRDWDSARDAWQAARDRVDAQRRAQPKPAAGNALVRTGPAARRSAP